MRINDFEKMQQNLRQMKSNLEDISRVESSKDYDVKLRKNRSRRAAKKKINLISNSKMSKIAREEQIIIISTIVIVCVTGVFSTSIFAKSISENLPENGIEKESVVENMQNKEIDKQFTIESNENVIPLEDILLENVSVLKSKEYAEEIREVEFEVKYTENSNLPEGEEEITKEGIKGTKQVTVIKSFENNVLVSENIFEEILLENPVPQESDIGTSKFLKNNQLHLGDTAYTTEDIMLKSEPNNNSEEICEVFKSLDVILEEVINDEWCKVEYDGLEGYIKCKNITSAKVTPGVLEANRIKRIKITLDKDMPLNESTNLTLEDYKKVLSGNAGDKNKIIEENAEVFYNMDKLYNINGIFLASMAIHESAWGTSTISKDKKNLFGYGAYDSSPYESSYSFDTYEECIELLTKVLVKYYINEENTPIYEEEVAKGSYYNGPTIEGVNTRYASDTNWHNKIYSYMEYLYNRL